MLKTPIWALAVVKYASISVLLTLKTCSLYLVIANPCVYGTAGSSQSPLDCDVGW